MSALSGGEVVLIVKGGVFFLVKMIWQLFAQGSPLSGTQREMGKPLRKMLRGTQIATPGGWMQRGDLGERRSVSEPEKTERKIIPKVNSGWKNKNMLYW